jgi:phosphomannomutase
MSLSAFHESVSSLHRRGAAPFHHRFAPSLLREYDIRGIVGETLTATDAEALGLVFGSLLGETGGTRVVVGYDGRLSSPALLEALAAGLLASGAEVTLIGLCPTPMLYFHATVGGFDGAVMITGSHNPPNYNGFKMMLQGKPFFGRAIAELGERAAAGRVRVGQGRIAFLPLDEAREAYVARLLEDAPREGGARKVVWDPGNGAVGAVLDRLVGRLPGQHLIINGAVDGTFPAHHPDPTIPRNLAELIARVRAEGADLGIAFDGDGDRIGIVDDTGEILFGDQIMVLLARDVLRTRPGATIIADVKASQVLFDEIARAGGKPLMWKTGHSLIKAKMAETGALLAGEMSGHIFFADHWYGFDDALYAAVRFLAMLAHARAPLSALRQALPARRATPELRFDCPEELKFRKVEEIAARLRAEGAAVDETDGVRVSTADGWWLLRASNTQAVLVARAEAADEAGLERLKAAIAAALAAVGLAAPDFSGAHAGH